METPAAPIVFKSLSKFGNDQEAIVKRSLSLKFCDIEYYQPVSGANGYYLLSSHSDPVHPVKLYYSAMTKLKRQLEFAFAEANKLEQQPQDLTDNETYDCGIINKYDKMTVRLVLSTFHQRVNVWLRLYVLNEFNQIIPTKTAVRFSLEDDLSAIGDFISS